MKLDIFFVIGLIVNVFMVVLYPAQILGTDPLDMSSETTVGSASVNNYYTVNGTGAISQYNSETGQIETNSNLLTQLESGVTSTEGSSGLFGSDTFTFVDWVKTGWSLLKTALMFVIGFIVLLFNLAYPLNILIGIPFALLYILGMVSFILGRI